jgi:hypothetical protein
MQTILFRRFALVALIIVGPCAIAQTEAQDWKWNEQPGQSIALSRDGNVVWQFNYGPDEPKPYFHPVALPGGPVVTWNQPPDHVWHHGLWFSWKFINGLNYWEPDATGKPQGRTEWADVRVTTRPDQTARIEMELTYRPADAEPVMTEHRLIDMAAPEADGRFHLDWTCTFTAGSNDVELDRTPLPGEPGGQAWGGYAGLSVRLARDLSERSADSTEGPIEFNAQSRYRGHAQALDYHGVIETQAIGVAICDHPDNLNHPTPWYVIRSQPMSYFSPAVICYAPYRLQAGKSFSLRYRVIIHPDRWDAERLRREYQQFVRANGS